MAMPDPHQQIGLECKSYWCDKILCNAKSIELRQYPLPSEFFDHDIWLLASGGEDGVASLGDSVEAGSSAATVVGWVRFSGNKEYHYSAEWEADEQYHHVPKGSPYGWEHGKTSVIYGWVIKAAERLPSPVQMPAATRMKRSLFLLHGDPRQTPPGA